MSNTQDLTPALFTANELSHLRKIARESESEVARKYLESAVIRAAEHLRAKKEKAK